MGDLLEFRPRAKPCKAISAGAVLLHDTGIIPLAGGTVLLGAVIGAHSPPAELLVTGTLSGAPLSVLFVGDRTTDVVATHPLLQVLEPLTLRRAPPVPCS